MVPLVLEAFAKIAFMFLLIMGFVPLLIWAERKGSAFIQDRTGPNRAAVLGIRLAGLVHPIADVLKLVFKEDVVPAQRHRFLYAFAPMLVMIVAMSTYAVIPFGDYLEIGGRRIPLVVADLEIGMLYILAIASLGTYGVALGGWASNSKYTFLGAMRSTASMISYEITMALSLLGLFMIFGTLQITQIVAGQGELIWGWLPRWGIVVQPVGFLLFIAAVYAETNRTPFDMTERDSEIVAGYHTEYSSLKFALFFMAEYAHMVVAAALISALFFGGYQIPWLPRPVLEANAGMLLTGSLAAGGGLSLVVAWLYFRRARRERGWYNDSREREPGFLGAVAALVGLGLLGSLTLAPWSVGAAGASIFATVTQIGCFIAKVAFFAWLFIWVRWTVPSFRYDQVMRLGWQIMLPVGLLNLAATAVWLVIAHR
ncbi:MAG: NADH-quinone oxidoreductase subunit H [Candidatus Krumholzibacteria bacterium]|jgi:NADH-quinone oxidoreductase subunit H|nr:NADH-quinone oxidoreductase subunit H [Candidatus Krumholzibacteria bacterium]